MFKYLFQSLFPQQISYSFLNRNRSSRDLIKRPESRFGTSLSALFYIEVSNNRIFGSSSLLCNKQLPT